MAEYDGAVILERLRALEAEVSALRRQAENSGPRFADFGHLQTWAFVQLTEALAAEGSASARFWKETDDGSLSLSETDETIEAYSPKYLAGGLQNGDDGLALRAYKRWWWILGGLGLVECCLAEDHPGRGIEFDVSIGTWNPATHGWDYPTGGSSGPGLTGKAIDWRYGTPYPGIGSKGLFIPRASDTYGTIYSCVSLDCQAPPEGCAGTSGSGT